MLNKISGTIAAMLFVCIGFQSNAQVGPGGVGNGTSDYQVWLKANAESYANNATVNPFTDQSGNGYNAVNASFGTQPTFKTGIVNNRPVVLYNGTSDVLELPTTSALNTAAYSQKTIVISFKTGADITSKQVVYEEGGGTNGINLYINNGSLYYCAWNGSSPSWPFSEVDTTINTGTTYYAVLQMDGVGGTLKGYLNGKQISTVVSGIGTLSAHSGNIGLGAMDNASYFVSGAASGNGDYFGGDIMEFLSFNEILNTAQRKIMDNYFGAKYGVTVPDDTLYPYGANYGYEVFGIGQDDAANNQVAAQGSGILKVDNPVGLTNGSYMLFGHNGGSISSWVSSPVPNNDPNTKRLSREWERKVTGTTLTSVDIHVDTTSLPAKPSGFTKYVLIIGNDSNFTTGTSVVEMAPDGNQFYSTTVSSGKFYTIGVVMPSVTLASVSGSGIEPTTGPSSVTVNFRLNYQALNSISVNYATSDGTAQAGQTPIADYNSISGTYTFAPGTTTASESFTINDDGIAEPDETVLFKLSSPSAGVALENSIYTYTIHDDDNPMKVEFTSSGAANLESVTPVIAQVHLSKDNVSPVSVDYHILGSSTATGGGVDYGNITASGTLNFPAHDTLVNLPNINVIDDAIHEANETIVIQLSNPVNANLGDTTLYTDTIIDNDAAPTVQFSSSSSSGLESIPSVNLTVQLSAVSGQDVTINYGVTGGTATGGGVDYTLNSGTLTIPAGSTTATIPISIINDAIAESNETIDVTLSSPSGATLGANSTYTYTIIDDDGLGWMGPGGVGNLSTQVNAWLRSSTAPGLSDGVSVGANASGSQWQDQSLNGLDAYQNTASQQPIYYNNAASNWNSRPVISFDNSVNQFLTMTTNSYMNNPASAQTQRTIIVAFRPGTDISNRQVIYEEGGGSRGLNIYIESDSLYIGGWNIVNDDAGATTPWNYTYKSMKITANTPYFAILQFNFNGSTGDVEGIVNGTDLGALPGAGKLFPHSGDIGIGAMDNGSCFAGGTCPSGNNYYFTGLIDELVSGNIVYNKAQMIIVDNYLSAKYNISIPASENRYDYKTSYGYEVFGIGQEDASDAHNVAQGSGIIKIDSPSNLATGDYMLIGHDGKDISGWSTTQVPNSDPNIERVNREWRVDKHGGDLGTITMRVDTTQLPLKSFGFSKYVLIYGPNQDLTTGSTVIEMTSDGDQYHSVSNLNLVKGDYFTIGEIVPSIEFADTAGSGSEPTTSVCAQVKTNAIFKSNITVNYATSDGTALASQPDYTAASGTFTMPAGDTVGCINLNIVNDVVVEPDENFHVTLSNPSSGTVIGNDTTYDYTIHDDDNSRKVYFDVDSSAGLESVTPAVIGVSINNIDPSNPTTVDYSVTGGTATNGGVDYNLANGTLTIPAGSSTGNISIPIVDDAIQENNETIKLTLSNPTNCNLSTTLPIKRTYTIIDNDAAPSVQFADTLASGVESYSPALLPVNMSAASGMNASVDYVVKGGTATPGGIDYTLPNGTLTFSPGTTTNNISLSIFNDAIPEPSETVIIALRNPVNMTLGADTVLTYTIFDDDNMGWLGPGGVGDSKQYQAWYRADAESYTNNATVSTFNDQSTNGHSATASGTAQPTYKNNASSNVNNRPVLLFNGSNNYLEIPNTADINTGGPYLLRTILVAFQTGANVTSRQVIYEEGGGTNGLNIYVESGNLYFGAWNGSTGWGDFEVDTAIAANTTYYALMEMDQSKGTLNGYLNGQRIVNTAITSGVGQLSAHGGNIGLGAMDNSSKFHGTAVSGNGYYFGGKIMEYATYNSVLNSAQKKIIANYFGAKYNITVPDNSLYDATYGTNYGYRVFGIGQDSTTSNHVAAQGSGIVKIDNPSSMSNGDYMLVGDDNAGIGVWTNTGVPMDSIDRVKRVWRVGKTGNLGSIRFAVDTTLLPTAPPNYTAYVLIVDVDGDGNFTTGNPKIYALNTVSGSFHLRSGITLNNGDFFTIGCARNRSIITGNWNVPATWLTDNVPGANETAIISTGTTVSLTANEPVGAVYMDNGGTLNLNSYQLTINQGTITNNSGTFNAGTGTVDYAATGNQVVAPLTYYNLTTSGGGTKTLGGNIILNNNLLIFGSSTLDVDAVNNYSITINGNWQSNATFNEDNGTVIFKGGAAQQINRSGGETFYNVQVDKTGGSVLLDYNGDVVSNNLDLLNGYIDLNSKTLSVTNSATTAITRTNGYILSEKTDNSSKLQWSIGTTAGAHTYPFGTAGGLYIPFVFNLNAASGDAGTVTVSTYPTNSSNLPWPATVTELNDLTGNNNSANVVDRFWQIDKAGPSGTAAVTFTATPAEVGGIANLQAQHWNGTGWDYPLPGQTNTATSATVPNVSTFSPWTLSGNNSPLPVELLNFEASLQGAKVNVTWSTASETNCDYFTVEKSTDGVHFVSVTNVQGHGNSSVVNNYSAVDPNPYTGISYYRLKQTDFDGRYYYSSVIAISYNSASQFNVNVYPNPTSPGNINLHITGAANNKVLVVVKDILGRTYCSKVLILKSNSQVFNIGTETNLAPGIYFVIATSNDIYYRKKLIIR